MGQLRPDLVVTGVIDVNGNCSLPLNHNNIDQVWVFEQISVFYSVLTDLPQVLIQKNGQTYSGAAQMLPGNQGLAQTFAGQPYLYAEATDNVQVMVTNGNVPASVNVQCQYRVIRYDDDELAGR